MRQSLSNPLKRSVCFSSAMFKVQHFCMVLTLHLYVVYGSHNIQQLLPYIALTDWLCITEVESVYCAVLAESL
jgi:hypothetical protein